MHVPIDNIGPVSGFLTGHNPRPTKSILYGAATAVLVYLVTPISYAIFFGRMIQTGSFVSIPTGFWASFWYWYSMFEIPFSIYLWILTRRAAKQPPPLDVEMETLQLLLTKSLTAGLAPAPEGPESSTRSLRSNGDSGHAANKKAAQVLGVKAFENRHVDHDDAMQRRERIRSWFFFADVEDIYEDNVREWLAWAFAARHLEEALADEHYARLINDGLEMVKLRLAWPDMKKGHNPKVKAIRLTLDPIKVMHRPFGYYVVTNGVSFATIAWLLLSRGFKMETNGKCTFLVKPADRKIQGEKPAQPILFLHGLGIGLGQYTSMLSYLSKHKDGVLILLQPHISTNIFSKYFLEPPSKDEQSQATISMLRKHRFDSVTTLSHSNGTMVLGWLLRAAPAMFTRNVLVDPVSFCMWEGSVCYSFIHRRWATGIEVLLGYFVGRELGVAHTIARRFLWFDMILWAEEFPSLEPEKLQFIFAERDVLVDIPGSVKYLTESGVSKESITVMRGYNHGQALIVDNDGMKLAMKHVRVRT